MFDPYDDDEEYNANIPNQVAAEDEEDLSPEEVYDVNMFLKVGLFCGLGWEDYQKMPILVKEYISKDIDNRLKPYIEAMEISAQKSGKSGGKGTLPLNFTHLALLLAISAAFGSGDE